MMTASLMIVQFIDLVMENPVIPHFKTIFDNHYNKYEEDLETSGLGESEPEPIIEDIF